MEIIRRTLLSAVSAVIFASTLAAQSAQNPAAPAQVAPDDPIRTIVGRLDLERYKATVKGLTQFGDRRQGTKRNRDAVDWIEAQLKSYGCTNTERIKYVYNAPAPREGAGGRGGGGRLLAGRGGRHARRQVAPRWTG